MRTAVVTGPSGIGFEVGRELARAGLRVVFAGRDVEKGTAAVDRVRSELPTASVEYEVLDLADLGSVSAFGRRVGDRLDRLDVLVNNAGVLAQRRRSTTKDGFELQFGTNHLGHFALTAAVLPLLRTGDAPRVVTVSSLAHRGADIDFDDLNRERAYRGGSAYGQSKLANLLFAAELQRRADAAGWGLTSVAAHPGTASTAAAPKPGAGPVVRAAFALVGRMLPSPGTAARPVLFAAISPDVAPGGYYGPTGFAEILGPVGPARLADRARQPELASRLWEVSEELTGVAYPR